MSASRVASTHGDPEGVRRPVAFLSPSVDALPRGQSCGSRLRVFHGWCHPVGFAIRIPSHQCSPCVRACHIRRVVGASVRRTECMAVPRYAGAPMAADCVHITQGTSQLVVTYEYYGFTAVTSRTLAVYAVWRVIVCCRGLVAL
jgi:hypothetical protein